MEEAAEKLDLLERTLALEQRQKNREQEMLRLKQQDLQQKNAPQHQEASSNSVLFLEEAERKKLAESMVRNPNSNGPIVKVLNNVQGTYLKTF